MIHAGTDRESAINEPGTALRRRGLVAAAAAFVAGTIAKRAAGPAAAANGDALIVGNTATATGAQAATATTALAASVAGSPALRVTNSVAAQDSLADGIQGYALTAGTAGTFGRNNTTDGVGIWGEAPSGTGAFGDSVSGSGVAGSSQSGMGVFGKSASSHGVLGTTQGSGSAGVLGEGLVSGSVGVSGQAIAGGAYAAIFSGPVSVAGNQTVSYAGGSAIVSYTGLAGYAGVQGIGNVPSSIGLSGVGTGSGSYAGVFSGPVLIVGSSTVTGTKSAAVPHPDGTRRLLFCMESPESWFEDFGHGTLAGGKAAVALDPDFAALVHTDDYHVFVTEANGGHHHLSVSGKHAGGFAVEADAEVAKLKGLALSALNGTFSWRVVARRKDVAQKRLPAIDLPKHVIAGPPDHPPVPTPDRPNLPAARKGG